MTITSSHKKLIGSFLLITPLYGICFMLIHYLLTRLGWAPNNHYIYIPFILAGAVAIYLLYFRKKVNAVGFTGAGTSSVPIMFFLSMVLAPMPFIQAIAIVTDRVVEINSIEQWSAAENESFIHIATMQTLPNEIIDTVIFNTATDDNDLVKTRYEYIALIPLASESKSAWLVFSSLETLDGNLPTAALREKQKSFWTEKRNALDAYAYDSIQYVVKSENEHAYELLKWKKRFTDKAILLSPSTESTTEYRISLIWLSSTILLILSVFFVFSVLFGNYEHIDHE